MDTPSGIRLAWHLVPVREIPVSAWIPVDRFWRLYVLLYVAHLFMEQKQLDDLDRKLIELLQANGRVANAAIAREVGVSEGTVRRRLQRLINEKIVRVVGVPDLQKMGLNMVALVGIQVDPDKMDSVATELAQLPEVQYVSLTTGSYDIFIWVAMASSEELGQFLRQKVGVTAGIRRTETFVHLAIVKNGYGIAV